METSNGPTLFQTLGGTAACRRLSVAFYARVARDPLLRPLFPGKSFTCAIEEFTAFLVQFLGGPGEDSQRRWWLSLRESHFRFKIGPAERAAWMKNMVQALDDVPIDESARKALLAFFRHSSQYVVNHPKASPAGNGLDTHEEISRRWEAQIHLDEAVAAIRAGDAVRAVALAGNPVLQLTGRSVPSGLLALMVRKGQSEMLDFVRAKLSHDPALVHGRYNGRTLLHEAAAAGSVTIVELLLHLGAAVLRFTWRPAAAMSRWPPPFSIAAQTSKLGILSVRRRYGAPSIVKNRQWPRSSWPAERTGIRLEAKETLPCRQPDPLP
ncbi:MAG: hypothetical protein HY248_04150 [Fimbriimonas ginsengisoli]|nr:hypothetical protein [Fimbriimonas ginsengisoli]